MVQYLSRMSADLATRPRLPTSPSLASGPRPNASAVRARRAGWIARAGLVFLIAGTISGGVDAQASSPAILHEQIPPDPSEDISFSATTLDGNLPAAIQTPSGVATAPDPQRPPSAEHVYSGGTTDDSPSSTYEPDRDTRRPNVEHYDDPFSPSTVPFKRLRAYDAVDESYTLRVQNQALAVIPIGGSVGPGDEPFYGDLSVDLIPNQPVRIPTVGPDTRILRLHTNPPTPVEVLRDGADNWFVRGRDRMRVRLVVQLAVARASFGSQFADVDWSTLAKHTVRQSPQHQASFTKVAQAIGISQASPPREVLRKMVEYFRSFEASDDPPRGQADIYLDLALSKKGVCRHRAFAFLVTALHIGLPSRMVVNEAHAWVEVYDGVLWHRIDLGGAAANLENDTDPSRPRYVPPPDPFEWPAQSSEDSGQGLADRSAPQAAPDSSGAPQPGPTGSATAPPAPTTAPTATASAPLTTAPGQSSEIDVSPVDTEVRRGFPFHLRGDVKNDGAPCPHLRVDVVLVSDALPQGAAVGSLSTDEKGHYDGAVVIPRDFALGDYRLMVETPGDAQCPAGRSK
jgi:hypothetical protein